MLHSVGFPTSLPSGEAETLFPSLVAAFLLEQEFDLRVCLDGCSRRSRESLAVGHDVDGEVKLSGKGVQTLKNKGGEGFGSFLLS